MSSAGLNKASKDDKELPPNEATLLYKFCAGQHTRRVPCLTMTRAGGREPSNMAIGITRRDVLSARDSLSAIARLASWLNGVT